MAAAVYVTGTGLGAVWLARTKNKRLLARDMQSELTARCNILYYANLNSIASLILGSISSLSAPVGGSPPSSPPPQPSG